MDRDAIEQQVRGYFADIDRFDLDATFARMADDIRLQVEPTNVTAEGREAVRGVYEHILAGCASMEHRVLSLAIDAEERRVAVELTFASTTKEGASSSLHDVTWIELAEDGRIRRVAFWLGHDALAA